MKQSNMVNSIHHTHEAEKCHNLAEDMDNLPPFVTIGLICTVLFMAIAVIIAGIVEAFRKNERYRIGSAMAMQTKQNNLSNSNEINDPSLSVVTNKPVSLRHLKSLSISISPPATPEVPIATTVTTVPPTATTTSTILTDTVEQTANNDVMVIHDEKTTIEEPVATSDDHNRCDRQLTSGSLTQSIKVLFFFAPKEIW